MTELLPPKNKKARKSFYLPGFGCVSLRYVLFRTSTRRPKAGKPYELHTAATITRAGLPSRHSVSYNVQPPVKSSEPSGYCPASGRDGQVEPAANLVVIIGQFDRPVGLRGANTGQFFGMIVGLEIGEFQTAGG
jgi:hypothetical protein